MLKELTEVWRYRDLLINLVIRDLKVRYKGSMLGFFWSLLNPLLQVATITIVFKFILDVRIPNYSAYVLCAFLPWTFLQMSLLDASASVLYHWDLVKKTYFPREILPASIVLSNLIHFILALAVFFVYLLVLGTPILITWLLVPVVVIIQLLLNLGIAFFVSCLNVFYEDIKYLMTVVLTLLFYLMPIMYLVEQIAASEKIPAVWKPFIVKFYFLNPLSLVLIAYRKLLLPAYHAGNIHDIPLNFWYLALSAVTSLLIFIAGYAFFNKRKWYFAERV